MRDARGRFIDHRTHTYRLTYADGYEDVLAITPSEAVAKRTRPFPPPHTLMDLTILASLTRRLTAFVAQPAPVVQYPYANDWEVY